MRYIYPILTKFSDERARGGGVPIWICQCTHVLTLVCIEEKQCYGYDQSHSFYQRTVRNTRCWTICLGGVSILFPNPPLALFLYQVNGVIHSQYMCAKNGLIISLKVDIRSTCSIRVSYSTSGLTIRNIDFPRLEMDSNLIRI
jgi:hypothetical protein